MSDLIAKDVVSIEPQPKQRLAIACPAFELFFGGAKGGGKSWWLIVDFLTNIKHGADHRGIIFRRTTSELEQLKGEAAKMYPMLGATFSKTSNTWVFPGGSTLKFRYLENEDDVGNYQGHEYTWVAFDEVTQWPTPFVYIEMMSCIRSAAGVPGVMRCTGNPGNIGHAWVKERFIDPMPPMKLYTDPDTTLTRMFIPARLEDNKKLTENDPNYEKRLLALKSTMPDRYKQFRFGDWNVVPGSKFHLGQEHAFDPFPIPSSWKKYASMDWGFAKPFSIGFNAVDEDGRIWRFAEWYGVGEKANTGIEMEASMVAKQAWSMASNYGIRELVADPACWSRHGHRHTIIDFFRAQGFRCIKGVKDRIQGIMQVHSRLSSDRGQPMLMISRTCVNTWRTLPSLLPDKNNPEDIDTKMEDHAYDDIRYACMHRPRSGDEIIQQKAPPQAFDYMNSGI